MERRSGVVILAGLLMGLLLLSGEVEHSEGAVACSTVNQDVAQCIAYARGVGPKPAFTSGCCNGIRALDRLASVSVQNRRNICTCLESAATVIKPKPQNVLALPGICGATHTINLSQNCNTLP